MRRPDSELSGESNHETCRRARPFLRCQPSRSQYPIRQHRRLPSLRGRHCAASHLQLFLSRVHLFLDPNNLGFFQFVWTNTTGSPIDNLTFTLFLDPDIDRDDNTYFNEYGEFLSALLPILAPSSALTFTDWEIDEPEYTFGNIYTHANEATLDNTSGVPASGPVDDVSHALLFRIAQLAPGQTLTVAGTLSLTDAAGLGHYDPDSDVLLYVNGYATLSDVPTSGVPEPATAALVAAALAAIVIRRK